MLKRLIPLAVAAIAAALLVSEAQAYVVTPRSGETLKDYDPTKSVKAFCPENWVVLGGGGEVRDDGNDIARLTGLVPVNASPRDYYEAHAEAWFEGQYEPWSLKAYAICAPASQVADHRVFSETVAQPELGDVPRRHGVMPGRQGRLRRRRIHQRSVPELQGPPRAPARPHVQPAGHRPRDRTRGLVAARHPEPLVAHHLRGVRQGGGRRPHGGQRRPERQPDGDVVLRPRDPARARRRRRGQRPRGLRRRPLVAQGDRPERGSAIGVGDDGRPRRRRQAGSSPTTPARTPASRS